MSLMPQTGESQGIIPLPGEFYYLTALGLSQDGESLAAACGVAQGDVFLVRA